MNKDNIQAYGKLCSLFYDAVNKYAPEQEVDFFASFMARCPGRALEAMSGSGRLQIPLMQRGYIVDGVDHSSAMLARCYQRCVTFGLEPNLYEQSLEKLSLPYMYSLIIIAFGSFQLITDDIVAFNVLKSLNAYMSSGGDLLIDIFEPDITIDDFSVSIARIDERSVIRLTKRHIFDDVKKIASTFCLYELMVDGIVLQRENELVEVVWRCDKQWQELLCRSGFEIVQIYDEAFSGAKSSRVIHARALIKNLKNNKKTKIMMSKP